MAITETVSLNVTGNAAQQLDKINKQVNGLSKSFGALRNALGAIALGGFITNTFRLADAMDDLSKATGFSIATIDSLSRAIAANGGNADDATSIITRFSRSLNDAKTEGGAALQALQKLGFSIQDLQQTDEQIFAQLLESLAQLPPSAERTALSMQLIGKNINTIDFKGLIEDQKKFYDESKKNAPAIKAAADLQQKFNTTLERLRTALMVSIQPLVEYLNSIPQEKINALIDSFTKMAVAIAGLATAAKVFSAIGAAFLAVKGYIALISTGAATITKTWTILRSQVGYFTKALAAAVGVFGKLKEVGTFVFTLFTKRLRFLIIGLGTMSAGVAALSLVIYALREAIKVAFDVDIFAPFIRAYDFVIAKAKEYLGVLKDVQKFEGQGGEFGGKGATGSWADDMPDPSEQIQALQDFKKQLNEITDSYAKNRQQAEEAAAAEVGYAMMATDTAEQIRAQRTAYDLVMASIEELLNKRSELGDEQREQKALIDQEIAKLYEQIPAATEAARVRVEALQSVKNAQEELIQQNEFIKSQLESDLQLQQLRDQINLIGLYGDELENQQMILEVSQNLERTLLDLRKQELDLIAKKGQLTEEQFKKELDNINKLRTAASERANSELDIKREQKKQETDIENSYVDGILRGLEDIKEQYKPINVAQDAVKKGWNSIENAIDTYIETGKFKFSDFARSVIADLAKMIAKAMIFKAISAALGAFGLSLPGMAKGGPVEGGKAYMVGEKGPELFVPQGSGTIVPNNKLGSGATNAMTGPITNNYNTYNINALDAKSVAQLFAENRKAIFGANKLAEREMSYAGVR